MTGRHNDLAKNFESFGKVHECQFLLATVATPILVNTLYSNDINQILWLLSTVPATGHVLSARAHNCPNKGHQQIHTCCCSSSLYADAKCTWVMCSRELYFNVGVLPEYNIMYCPSLKHHLLQQSLLRLQ